MKTSRTETGLSYSLLQDDPVFMGQYFHRGQVARTLGVAIDLVLREPLRAQVMGEAGRAHVLRNFDQRYMVEATARLFRRLAAK